MSDAEEPGSEGAFICIVHVAAAEGSFEGGGRNIFRCFLIRYLATDIGVKFWIIFIKKGGKIFRGDHIFFPWIVP